MTAAAQTFLLPDLGEGLTEAEVVRWLVAPGEAVGVDQAVVEVETAKATVELPTPFAGVVTEVYAAVGETLGVGRPLLSVAEVPADGPSAVGGPAPSAGEPQADASGAGGGLPDGGGSAVGEVYREEERAGSGAVLIGYGTGASSGPRRHRRPRSTSPGPRRGAAAPGEPAAAPGSGAGAPGVGAEGAGAGAGLRVVSPLVRRLAREWGVDVRDVRGTGHGGLILRTDVERAAANPGPPAPRRTAPNGRVPAPNGSGGPAGGARQDGEGAGPPEAGAAARVPLTARAAAAAAVYERSRREIPEVTLWADVDATPLVALRDGLRPGPGLIAYLARFTVAALRDFPVFNAQFDADRREIVHQPHVGLGLAVQGSRGLVVPTIPNAETLTTTGLDTEIRRLTDAARDGIATPANGTFTLNNYGAFDVDGSTPILVPPQVGMLAIGRILARPWIVDGAVVPRRIATLSLVFDHRVCDGATAAGFLRRVADAIENPAAAVARL